jgi:hypothetical protein
MPRVCFLLILWLRCLLDVCILLDVGVPDVYILCMWAMPFFS